MIIIHIVSGCIGITQYGDGNYPLPITHLPITKKANHSDAAEFDIS